MHDLSMRAVLSDVNIASFFPHQDHLFEDLCRLGKDKPKFKPALLNEIGPWLTNRVADLYDSAPKNKRTLGNKFYNESWRIKIDAGRQSGGTFLAASLFTILAHNLLKRFRPFMTSLTTRHVDNARCFVDISEKMGGVNKFTFTTPDETNEEKIANLVSIEYLEKLLHSERDDRLAKTIHAGDPGVLTDRVLIIDNARFCARDGREILPVISGGDASRIESLSNDVGMPRVVVTIG